MMCGSTTPPGGGESGPSPPSAAIPSVVQRPEPWLRNARPQEYLARLLAQNRVLEDDIRLEGKRFTEARPNLEAWGCSVYDGAV